MRGLLSRVYRALRARLLPGLADRDRQEIDDLIDHRLEAARARSGSEAIVWLREITDLFRAARRGPGSAAGRAGPTGSVLHAARVGRSVRGGCEQLVAEVVLAARSARRAPGFSAAAILVLGLGVGASTAVFSVADAALIQSLPFPESDRLVAVTGGVDAPEGFIARNSSYPELSDWRSGNRTLDGLAAWTPFTATLIRDEGSTLAVIAVEGITEDYFSVLGVDLSVGRAISPLEHTPGAPGAVVLSHRLWESAFGADPTLLGRTIRIDDRSWQVVGVAASSFHGLSFEADAWLPVEALVDVTQRGRRGFPAVGRLRESSNVATAAQDLVGIAAGLEEAYPEYHANRTVRVTGLRDALLGSTGDLLVVLLGAVGGLLLIACVNLTNLILVRSSSRSRAALVRRALGASGRRVFLQCQAETLVLATGGAAVGCALAVVGTDVLRSLTPPDVLPAYVAAGVDVRAMIFAAAVALAAGVLIGVVPAVKALRTDPANGLREGGAATGARHRDSFFQQALVVAEVSLALVLLIGTGLMVRNLEARLRVDPGMDLDRVVAFRVEIPETRAAADEIEALLHSVASEIETLGTVERVSWVSDLPLSNDNSATSVLLEGVLPPNDEVRVYTHRIEPGAFEVLGISLLSGRGIEADDSLLEDPVVVVSNALARRYFGEADPIGRRMLFNSTTWVRIVGVVEDVRYRDLTSDLMADDDPDVYLAYYRDFPSRDVGFVVRTVGDSGTALSIVGRTAEASLAGIPVQRLAPLSHGIRNATALARFGSVLFATFGLLAGVLAAIGIHGVIAVSVGLRRQEIAIRMALGAGEGPVLSMVMRQGGLLAAVGLGLGLVGAIAASRSLGAFLFGVEPVDVMTYTVVTALLGAVAALATWLPARRATRVQPSQALRPS